MIRGFISTIAASIALLAATPARAELTLCNRTSDIANARGCPASQQAHFSPAARNPVGIGFSWCNDTRYAVMASLGIVEMGAIVTRGWYRIEAGQCVRSDLRGDPHRLYSYAEAVDADGRAIKRGDVPLAWGGAVALCTRDGRFELADHKDCPSRGLNSAGFAVIDLGSQPATTVRFKEP